MKKYGLKILSVAMICLLLIGVLASCGGNKQKPEESTTVAEGEPTREPDTTGSQIPEVERVDLFQGNPSDFVVLYPSTASADLKATAKNFTSTLNDYCGTNIKCMIDSDVDVKEGAKEILIGNTNRSESASMMAKLKAAFDYVIYYTGNRLVIVGGGDASIANAVSYLLNTCVTPGVKTMMIEKDMNRVWRVSEEAPAMYTLANTYRIVYGENASAEEIAAANKLAQLFTDLTRKDVKAFNDHVFGVSASETSYQSTEKEILIGKTNRAESTKVRSGLNALDYEIRVTDTKVVVTGGSAYATGKAVDRLIEALLTGSVPSTEAGAFGEKMNYEKTYVQKYARPFHYDQFVPVWSSSLQIPDWMHELNEKIYALTTPDARNMSASKGGDTVNYTSNSVEALASAIKAGVDLLVVDVYFTKDMVPVVISTENLNLVTDYSSYKGTEGYPYSSKVSGWTYDQLQALHIKNPDGTFSENGIWSLYEVTRLCRGRCFLMFNNCSTDPAAKAAFDSLTLAVYQAVDAFDSYFEPDPTNITVKEPYLITRLNEWNGVVQSGRLTSTITTYQTSLKKPNHWMRRLFTCSESMRGVAAESAENWGLLAEQSKSFLYVNDVVSYCAYIAKQPSSLVNDDLRASAGYTLEESTLLGRVMIFSDIHYDTRNNKLGYNENQRIQKVREAILKEMQNRGGLDAVLILGDLTTDDKGTLGTYSSYNTYFKDLEVPVYVLPGNHDCYSNDTWKKVFGTDRQFSIRVKDMVFVMLDVYNATANPSDPGSGGSKKTLDYTWLKKQIEANSGCRFVICAHWFSDNDVSELQKLAAKYPGIIALFHAHTHIYQVKPGTAYLINEGGISYTPYANAANTVWDFGFLDIRSAWAYQILEWNETDAVTYRVMISARYKATNMTYYVPEDFKHQDILLTRS